MLSTLIFFFFILDSKLPLELSIFGMDWSHVAWHFCVEFFLGTGTLGAEILRIRVWDIHLNSSDFNNF